jgi:hypothetical protein
MYFLFGLAGLYVLYLSHAGFKAKVDELLGKAKPAYLQALLLLQTLLLCYGILHLDSQKLTALKYLYQYEFCSR